MGTSKRYQNEIGQVFKFLLFQVETIEKLLKEMNKGVCSKNLLEECPELGEKIVENEKLKYRLNILKRVSFLFLAFLI